MMRVEIHIRRVGPAAFFALRAASTSIVWPSRAMWAFDPYLATSRRARLGPAVG